MSKVLVEESCLQNIANAIRAKNNKTDKYLPNQMADAILAIDDGVNIVSPDKWSFNLVQSDNQTISFTPVSKLIYDASNKKYSSAIGTDVKIEPYTGYVPGTVKKSADTKTKVYTITATPAEEIAGMIENGYAKVYEDNTDFYSDEKYTTRLYSLSGKILVAGMKETKMDSTPQPLYNNSKITGFKNTFVTSVENAFLSSCYNLTLVDLPNLTSAGDSFLMYCKSLTSVSSPNLTSAGDNVLYGCSNLTLVDLPNLTSAGGSFLYGCESLTSVDLPNLTSAGDSFLMYCKSLTSVSSPNLTSAGDSFLYGCESLTSVDLPNLTSAGDSFLMYCKSLTSVSSPNLTSAGDNVLYGCSNLTLVDLPNLTSAGDSFLYGCSNLTLVFLRSSVVCKLGTSQTFPSKCSFYVPASIVDSYKTDNVWKRVADRIKTLESISLTKISISGLNKINIFYDKNTTQNYSIKYNDGVVNPEQEGVTWSITGNATITQNGVVTLNNAKAGDKITITATSTYNNSISASLAVSIISTNKEMNIDLNNGQWVDSGTQVDGHTVYKSNEGSYHISNGRSTCTINVMGYSSVTVYARSYAESSYDYLEVGPLDGTVTRGASSNVLSTSGNQSSTTYLSHTFTIEDKGQHTFQILYSKDSSGNNDDDRGYFYIVAE